MLYYTVLIPFDFAQFRIFSTPLTLLWELEPWGFRELVHMKGVETVWHIVRNDTISSSLSSTFYIPTIL